MYGYLSYLFRRVPEDLPNAAKTPAAFSWKSEKAPEPSQTLIEIRQFECLTDLYYSMVSFVQIRFGTVHQCSFVVTLHEKPSAPDTLFRLNSDMLCAFA